MRIVLVQLDGKLPNLALMRLAAWHRARGDHVELTRAIPENPLGLNPERYDRVYASAIFEFSDKRIAKLRMLWPDAIIGGTGLGPAAAGVTVESVLGDDVVDSALDYADYPNFTASLGFTQRGCRLKCKFCVVPTKEGKNRTVNTIAEIWRGPGMGPLPMALWTADEREAFDKTGQRPARESMAWEWPRHLHLLDNDFFGQPEDQWRARIDEIRAGQFKVCFNQGINIRLLANSPGAAEALASIDYSDDGFKTKRLYTAWDNLKDERVFFDGVSRLREAGISPRRLLVYMLVGYDKNETWERIHYRFNKMTELGIKPYPMVYDIRHRDRELWQKLKHFQRWAIWLSGGVKWEDYGARTADGKILSLPSRKRTAAKRAAELAEAQLPLL